MPLLLFFAFISGLVTILAPCIWPLLPIILSSSIAQKGHARPLGITIGILISFGIFTLTISSLVMVFHFDPSILRLVAVLVIGFLGLTMVIPSLSRVTEGLVSRLSGIWGQKGQLQGNSFFPGFITGLSLGIVWTPCAGPILAAIATLAATSQLSLNLVLITVSYLIGVGIPLFLFAYGGQKLIHDSRFISKYTGRIQQVFGVIMILTALAIYTNYDKVIQAKLLDLFPQYTQALTKFESDKTIKDQLDVLKGKETQTSFGQAPEFIGVTHWLNIDKPLTMESLRGKVVLIDFWTYTCINCIRTLPYVTSWYDKYKDAGFVVIGVHTPEFEFEKKTENVQAAIKQFNIHYPVAQDNDYATWNAYNNQYWPAEYLIDAKGQIRRTHFGEGNYDETEKAIQDLLEEAGNQAPKDLIDMPDQTPRTRLSPESYLGATRMQYLYPDGRTSMGKQVFNLSENIPVNNFSFGGEWTIADEYATASQNAVLTYNFNANKVFLVLGPSNPASVGKIKVFLDGKEINEILVDSERLYNIIDLKGQGGTHILRIEFETGGIKAFAFTFG